MMTEVEIMAEPDYVESGFVWVEDLVKKYKRSRSWIWQFVHAGEIAQRKYPGDRHLYIKEADLVRIISTPKPEPEKE